MKENKPTATDRLYSLINYEQGFAKYNAKNYIPGKTGKLLRSLNIPFEKLRFIHIAGTKGKGSTAHYLSVLLESLNYRVGLFTSPHLFRLHERIQINQKSIQESELSTLLDRFEKVIRDAELTFFDALTFLACVYFLEKNCDFVVFETGLGGRLDSTNFVNPVLSLITPISFDHTALLGNTLSKIAQEKAGIIKPKVPILIAPQKQEALQVIQSVAKKNQAPLFDSQDLISYTIEKRSLEGCLFHAHIRYKQKNNAFQGHLRQIGDVFVQNFLIAVLAVLLTGNKVTAASIHQAAKTPIKARMQFIRHSLIDVSHNKESLEELFRTLSAYFPKQKKHLMIGLIADKEISSIADLIRKNIHLFEKISVFDFDHPRKSGGKELFRQIKSDSVFYYPDIADLQPEAEYLNVLTGSFYTVAPYSELFLSDERL